MTRLACLALVTLLLLPSLAPAGGWVRSWSDPMQQTGDTANIQAETLDIKDGRFTLNRDFPFFNVNLKFHPKDGSTRLPGLMVGESEGVYAFVVLASETAEGTVYYGLKLLVLVPSTVTGPFEWVPRGFKKRNSDIPDEDPRVALRQMGLIPEGAALDLWVFYHPRPETKRSLETLHAKHAAAPLKNFFPAQLDCASVRGTDYRIPSTIDRESLRLTITDASSLTLYWNDPAMAAAAGSRERIRYRFGVDRRVGTDSAFVWRSNGEGTVNAAVGQSEQQLSLGSGSVALTRPFERNTHYRITLRVERDAYGTTPVEAVERAFVFIPGLTEEDGFRPDEDSADPFGSLNRLGN